MPEEVSKPTTSAQIHTGTEDLGCNCNYKVDYNDIVADLGPGFFTVNS